MVVNMVNIKAAFPNYVKSHPQHISKSKYFKFLTDDAFI